MTPPVPETDIQPHMKPDRFLIGILVAIGLLVVLALGLFFIRQRGQEYGTGDSPQEVVRNYVLALEKGDYARAYAMLQVAEGQPDYNHFLQAFLTRQVDPGSTALVIQDSLVTGDEAVVSLVIIHENPGPFEQPYREPATALLAKDSAGAWKIKRLPYPYWGWDWYATPVPGKTSP